MSMWYASCVFLRLENVKESESWKKLYVGGIDGISCQHFSGDDGIGRWQENRRPMMRHGSVIRPTMYLSSVDVKTAFEVARPKHIVNYER